MISILDDPVCADNQHALLERVENAFEQAAFPREPLHKVGQIDRIESVETSEHAIQRGVFLDGHAQRKSKPEPRCNPPPSPKAQPNNADRAYEWAEPRLFQKL
jgi:hypothetical protein